MYIDLLFNLFKFRQNKFAIFLSNSGKFREIKRLQFLSIYFAFIKNADRAIMFLLWYNINFREFIFRIIISIGLFFFIICNKKIIRRELISFGL